MRMRYNSSSYRRNRYFSIFDEDSAGEKIAGDSRCFSAFEGRKANGSDEAFLNSGQGIQPTRHLPHAKEQSTTTADVPPPNFGRENAKTSGRAHSSKAPVLRASSTWLTSHNCEEFAGSSHPPQPKHAGRQVAGEKATRFPLTARTRYPQATSSLFDRPGLPTGKENIPLLCDQSERHRSDSVKATRHPRSHGRYCQSWKTRQQTMMASSAKGYKAVAPRTKGQRMEVSHLAKARDIVETKTLRTLEGRLTAGKSSQKRLNTADIRMLGEPWLGRQETVIAEVLNGLLQASGSGSKTATRGSTRFNLKSVYAEPQVIQLCQKLQGSLQFGALALPRGSAGIARASRLFKDVSIRTRFIDLWTKSYKRSTLQGAFELVIGPHMRLDNGQEPFGAVLQDSIEQFLMRTEDLGKRQDASAEAQILRSWQRTVLRSLMVIYLIDRAQQFSRFHSLVFKRNAPFRSSSAILKELITLLGLSFKETDRALARIGYHLACVQDPTSEHEYTVENLAVDFRDGIRLARLVEIVYHPFDGSSSQGVDRSHEFLPKSQTSETHGSTYVAVFSQGLRVPAMGQPTKERNVQLALDALAMARNIPAISSGIVTATDIVEGHREKTFTILWSLACDSGLNHLVDWCDLVSEIARLQSGSAQSLECIEFNEASIESVQGKQRLLQLWALSIARKHGCIAGTLAAAFENGGLLDLLVAEYWRLLATEQKVNPSHARLEEKLAKLGCSSTLGECTKIDSLIEEADGSALCFGLMKVQEKTVERYPMFHTLAFLCSKFLNATMAVRRKREFLRRLASDCQRVVQEKHKPADASVNL